MYTVVCVILLCSVANIVVSEVGDECFLPTKEKGSCSTLSKCPYAQNLLHSGNRPVPCGFVGTEPVVCCVEDSAAKPQPLVASQTPPPKLLDADIPHSLSEKKCIEWYPRPVSEGPKPHFIAGGKSSLPYEFPHMALLGYGSENNIEWKCGGSLIHPKFVLTAAHCLKAKNVGDARFVRLGDLDISTESDSALPETRLVIRRIPHPSYKSPQRYHDIALLELDRNTKKTQFVAPACLSTENIRLKTLTATGWGTTEFGGKFSKHLMKIDLDYVQYEQCAKSFGNVSPTVLPNGIRDDIQICAGGVIGQDTCQGDSGGPLQTPHIFRRVAGFNVHIILGITSLGKACGLSKAPGIYTRVASYIPWIESILWPNEKF